MSKEGNEKTVPCLSDGRGHRQGKDLEVGACLCSLEKSMEEHGSGRTHGWGRRSMIINQILEIRGSKLWHPLSVV